MGAYIDPSSCMHGYIAAIAPHRSGMAYIAYHIYIKAYIAPIVATFTGPYLIEILLSLTLAMADFDNQYLLNQSMYQHRLFTYKDYRSCAIRGLGLGSGLGPRTLINQPYALTDRSG